MLAKGILKTEVTCKHKEKSKTMKKVIMFSCALISLVFGVGGIAGAFTYAAKYNPEPATMLLVGSGLVVIAGLGRKKFFKKSKS